MLYDFVILKVKPIDPFVILRLLLKGLIFVLYRDFILLPGMDRGILESEFRVLEKAGRRNFQTGKQKKKKPLFVLEPLPPPPHPSLPTLDIALILYPTYIYIM